MAHWFREIMTARRFEPHKRKHGSTVTKWIGHRFPINGGISLRDTMIRDFAAMRNPLFDLIVARDEAMK